MTITLYHGTSEGSATRLMTEGWSPGSGYRGNHCGNTRYLYLTTFPENAMWYANEKGDDVVLAIEVEVDALIVDPEDGLADTVAEELAPSSMPGNVALTRSIPAGAITRWLPTPRP